MQLPALWSLLCLSRLFDGSGFNLKDITGSPAHIRVGGTTSNHATWVPEQEEAIIQNYATPGADQPANVTLGPRYLEAFHVFPRGTKYTVGVTFDSGLKGEDASVQQAEAFHQSIGEDLFAMEVGNEFDVFPVDRNETTWSIQQYVTEWLDRTRAIAKRVFKDCKNQKLFQAGAFVAPGSISNDTSWTAQAAMDLGIASTGHARTFCTHQYFGAACRPVQPTLEGNVMNRTELMRWMVYHDHASAYTVSKGVPYVLGETNSIACQGLTGVSDVFGAAVWSVDYALYAASLNVSGIYWHMGTGYRYAPWQAIQNGTTSPGPRPLYYGNWFLAAALGGTKRQVVPIVNTTSLAGYAIYSPARGRGSPSLQSVVLVNMEVYNSSIPESRRSSVEFRLPSRLVGRSSATTVRRLTAAGAEVRDNITFSSQIVGLDGRFEGREVREKVADGIVQVQASEAVLISLH
ncbi:hypothetical protein BS50DRAFT_651926 [Corynespora cassiicola Philippines]|uniref:Beta-glucuronidase C-terminal domain-containing protein n=1 Tax=Corynespora cassiicola Philippines TaxID=1448308 RepID=A0A2T2N6S1_CORCC|nr:hypothetical protein BS50DRAFT_651926 [Corynespora cassiicola Philippines]